MGLIAVFSAGFLLVLPTNATVSPLIVEYWSGSQWLLLSGPIFNETNFLPGEGVTRLIRVTNNSGQTQRIATEAINKNDPNWLGNVLNLEIKESGVSRYNNPLSKFFTAGEVYLSNLGNGAQTQYDFIVSFYSGAQNPFQGKSLGFDILVGFQGEEGGLLPGAGGGAGGFLPPGLTIQDESVRITVLGETSVTLTWTTSYFSTSQVIYSRYDEPHILDLTDNTGTPPKYGYKRTTPEYDVSSKVTAHSVTITGLTPGTTYYYRAVSHASLAISREYSFTTLVTTNEGTDQGLGEGGGVSGGTTEGGSIQQGQGLGGMAGEGISETGGSVVGAQTGESGGSGGEVVGQTAETKMNSGEFLAAISNFFNLQNSWWILIIIIVILIILFFLFRKKKE